MEQDILFLQMLELTHNIYLPLSSSICWLPLSASVAHFLAGGHIFLTSALFDFFLCHILPVCLVRFQ